MEKDLKVVEALTLHGDAQMRRQTIAVALLVALVATGLAGAMTFTATNTVIVLPTTKVVNNTPLHINEDAISGSILGSWIEWNSLQFKESLSNYTVHYSVHSVPFWLTNGTYYLTKSVMPDVGMNLSTTPDNDSFTILVNFSKVFYNSTAKDVLVKAGALKVIFTNDYSPISLGLNGKYVVANDNMTEVFAYDKIIHKDSLEPVGGSIEIDGWKVKILDVSSNTGELLLDIIYPTGDSKEVIAQLNSYFVWYVKGGKVYTTNVTNVTNVLKEGVQKLAVLHFGSVFIGNEYQLVGYNYTYYEFDKCYKDGEVYKGNWVWDIISPSEFALVYNANTTLKDGGSIAYPFGNLYLDSHVTNESAQFIFERVYQKTVAIKTISDVSLPKPYNLIITDEKAVSSLPATNIIVIGGWVSNKFWSVLEKYYPDAVAQMKKEVMDDGYVVKFLPNPVNKNAYIVVLAGKTYVQTHEAVMDFINTYILGSGSA